MPRVSRVSKSNEEDLSSNSDVSNYYSRVPCVLHNSKSGRLSLSCSGTVLPSCSYNCRRGVEYNCTD